MPLKVKKVTILDDTLTPVNQLTAVVGLNVRQMNVQVELEGSAAEAAAAPTELSMEVMAQEPKIRRVGMSSMSAALSFVAKQDGSSLKYKASVALSSLAKFMKAGDGILEVATVVRTGGTSDALFRSHLQKAGWALRGVAIQPAIGKTDSTGNAAEERPDARTLFLAGGVEVLEVKVISGTGVTLGSKAKAWVFVRSPADIFFYSGHGAWWDCALLREQAGHTYDDWMTAEELTRAWKRQPDIARSPMDLDVLIINGCSVLLWDKDGYYDPSEVPSCGLRWRDLMVNKKGPLFVILGYRDTAPLDNPRGNEVANEMGKAIATDLGTDWGKYARKWLEINAKQKNTWSAAAIDQQGYWYINMKSLGGREVEGYDSTKKEGTILGPFALP